MEEAVRYGQRRGFKWPVCGGETPGPHLTDRRRLPPPPPHPPPAFYIFRDVGEEHTLFLSHLAAVNLAQITGAVWA